MATRLFFTNSAPGFTPTTIRGAWDQTTGAIAMTLGLSPAGASATRAAAETSGTNNFDVLWGRWITDPIAKSGNLSGIVTWVIAVQESATTANDFVHMHVYVTAGDTDTVRGTLLTDFIGTAEFPTTATGAGVSDTAISTVAVQAGDRIVVEVGYQAQNTTTLSRTGTMTYGLTDVSGVLIPGDTTITFPGWIQFSDPENVIAGDYGVLRHNFCLNPALGVDSVRWSRGTNATESRLTGQAGFDRSTAYRAAMNSGTNPSINSPLLWVAAGESWAASIQVRCSRSVAGLIWFNYQNISKAFLTPNPNTSVTYGTTVQTVTFTAQTAPTNAVSLMLSVESSAATSGDQFDASCCVYDTATIPDYKDGDSPSWVWLGTAGSSVSQEIPPSLLWPHRLGPNYRR